MLKGKKIGSLLLLAVMIVSFTVLPGHADNETPVKKLTLQEAVDLAIKNNPQVGMAEADKKKKYVAYQQAKSDRRKIEDSIMDGTYEGNLVMYLQPKIAERQGEQAEKIYEITINGVRVQAEKAFYDLIQAKENQIIAENALRRAEEGVRIAKVRFDVGSASKVEVLTAEAMQSAANAALTAARNDTKQKMLELNKVLGIDLNTVIEPQGTFEFKKEKFKIDDLLNKALTDEMSVIQAQGNYDIANWSFEFVKSYYSMSNWEARKAEQDMLAAKLMLEQTKDNVVTAVHQSYYSLIALEEQYEYLLKTVELKQEAYRLKQLSYEVGMATLNEVQEASDAVKEAEVNLSDCIYKYNTLKSSLKYNIYSGASSSTMTTNTMGSPMPQ